MRFMGEWYLLFVIIFKDVVIFWFIIFKVDMVENCEMSGFCLIVLSLWRELLKWICSVGYVFCIRDWGGGCYWCLMWVVCFWGWYVEKLNDIFILFVKVRLVLRDKCLSCVFFVWMFGWYNLKLVFLNV